MAISEQEIRGRIAALYPGATIDVSGEDCSFEVYVISEQLEGLGTLKRQQSILALFKPELKSGTLHALSVRARTPGEQQSGAGLVQIEGLGGPPN